MRTVLGSTWLPVWKTRTLRHLLPFASKLTIANLSKQTESRLSLSRCTPSTLRAMLICFVNSYINSGIVYLNLYLSHLCVNPLEHIVSCFTKIHYQIKTVLHSSYRIPMSSQTHHPRIFSSAARVVSTLLLYCLCAAGLGKFFSIFVPRNTQPSTLMQTVIYHL